jgi:hypothetical protein
MDPVVNFDQDRRRDNERLSRLDYQTPGCSVIGVVSIERSVEGTSVED